MTFIQKTLKSLHSRINNNPNRSIEIIAEKGVSHTVTCSFNPPINQIDIDEFEKKINHKLPEDYREFLLLHNGVRIFDMLLDGIDIGGGLEIYSLEEISDVLNSEEFQQSSFLPIGYISERHLVIDLKSIKESNYLFTKNSAEVTPLYVNFELFIDRYIISQGANFWEWPIYTAKNYYDLDNGIEF